MLAGFRFPAITPSVVGMNLTKTAVVALALFALVGCVPASSDDADAAAPAVTPSETPSPEPEVPDVVDLNLEEARELLDGFEIVEIDASGEDRVVWSPANWFVVSQSVDGSVVTLDLENERDAATAEREAEREALEAATNGVTEVDAQIACERVAEDEFPYGVRYHSLVGVYAKEFNEDTGQWFLKIDATVTNAFNAEQTIVTECHVDTESGNAVVASFIYY